MVTLTYPKVSSLITSPRWICISGWNGGACIDIPTGYRSGTVSLTGGGGSGATLSARVGPKLGHGKNAKTELGGAYVMMNVRLVGTEGGDFTVGDDFRKVILIANPYVSGSAATASTYSGAEMDDDNGEQIYMEFRAPINRASDQTEDVKLVVEF